MCDYDNVLPRSWQMFTMAIAHFNSAANPILYGIFNPSFRKGYSNFLKRIFFIKNNVSSHSTNTKIEVDLKSKVTANHF